MALVDVVQADLEILAAALAEGRIQSLDRSALQSLGLGDLAGSLQPLDGLTAESALPALQAVLAERRRPSPRLELVWTGPEAGLRPARDTAVVVRELFARAERRVIVGGGRAVVGFAALEKRRVTLEVRCAEGGSRLELAEGATSDEVCGVRVRWLGAAPLRAAPGSNRFEVSWDPE